MVHTHHRTASASTDGMCCGSMLCMRVHIPTGTPHSGRTQPHSEPQRWLPAQYTIERETARLSGHRWHVLRLYHVRGLSGHRWHVLRLYHVRAATIGAQERLQHRLRLYHVRAATIGAQERLQHRLRLYHGTHPPSDSLSLYHGTQPHTGHTGAHRQPQRLQMKRKRKKQQKAHFVTAFVAILLLCIFL